MAVNKYKLYYHTQTPKFLISAIFSIFLIGFGISSLINYFYSNTQKDKLALKKLISLTLAELNQKNYEKELTTCIKNPNLDLEEFLLYIKAIAYCEKPKLLVLTNDTLIKHSSINPHYKTITLFLKAIIQENETENLKLEAEKSPPNFYANRLLADFYIKKNNNELAIEALQREPTLRQSKYCKGILVSLLIKCKKNDELKKIVDNPDYKDFQFEIKGEILSGEKQWLQIFLNIIDSQTNIDYNGIFLLTILTGIVWFSIWFHALRPDYKVSSFSLCIFAFACGVFSTTLTLFAIELEQHFTNIREGETLIQGLLYFIFSVGLREEFLKILMFLPLVPLLVKRQNQLEWLIIPGMVGLGFAIEENLSYFLYTDGASFAGRFLIANFLHVGLTALIGESICYYFYDRSRGAQHMIATFSMAVILHGLYNSFIAVPQLSELFFVTMIVLIYIAFQFFGRLKMLRSNLIEPISLSTHFVISLAILFMCAFIYFSFQGGHYFAAKELAMTFIDMVIVIYMFLYLMPNSIIKL